MCQKSDHSTFKKQETSQCSEKMNNSEEDKNNQQDRQRHDFRDGRYRRENNTYRNEDPEGSQGNRCGSLDIRSQEDVRYQRGNIQRTNEKRNYRSRHNASRTGNANWGESCDGNFDALERRYNQIRKIQGNTFHDVRRNDRSGCNISRNDNSRQEDNGHNFNNQNDGFRRRPIQNRMSFKFAEKIGENDNAEEVIQNLFNDRNGFNELLKENELSGDWLVLIIQILTKICDTSFTDSKIKIFQTVLVHSNFSKQLTKFISNLPNHNYRDKKRDNYFWSDTDKFWNNIITVFEDIVKFPSFASQNLPVLLKAIKRTLPAIEEEHTVHIADVIKETFDILLIKTQSMKSEYEQNSQVTHHYNDDNNDEDNENPPNDFREISLFPTIFEVTSNDKPFLRKNKVMGSYIGILHYLDVQFRLLREDFVSPLRKGICQYLKNPKQGRFDDVKIYQKVHFLANENVNELNCIRIQYDFTNHKKSFKYDNSKMFMYGSLVCFTKDRFRNLIFGKIVKRDTELLKKGELIVGFDTVEDISFNTDYIMVESSIYFEPYYHVLTALQRISLLNQFPMERYIIYAEAVINPPKYLTENTSYTIQNKHILPLSWRDNNTYYGLNESQKTAFKAALTQEIVVIQGPPGTGKTYLGLKIAQTLLKNEEVWCNNSPILVICYTNHALDQFLEGILPYTKHLLRIGGQSKNEQLNKYNLRNAKYVKKSAAFYQSQRDIKVCLSDLKSCNNIIDEILQYNSVIDFSLFADVVPNFKETWFYSATTEEIITWLLSGIEYDDTDFDTFKIVTEDSQSSTNNQSDSEDETGSDDNDSHEEIDEIYNKIKMITFRPLISLQSVKDDIDLLQSRLDNLSQPPYEVVEDGEYVVKNEIYKLNKTLKYLESNLKKVKTPKEILNPNISPQLMSPKQRWALYSNWLQQYCHFLKHKREEMYNEYREKHKIYTDQRNIEDVRIMRENLVVGMTTTGAARLRTSLEALKSPIVIVEEAAEILEAHIVSALTVHCQHLILIGDHKQLKPSTADYNIETEYRLGISLFERMVNNNLQCYRLTVQHRMKPEICDLIRPTIYPDLIDHDSVKDRPTIKGIDKDIFFIDHEYIEESCSDSSKKNIHEAKFLIHLAKHLILNGYEDKNITILAAYLGQMFEIQREKKKHSLLLGNVRIAVLDNYQGEESDIILLSLVRNNKEQNIGFLKIENRVCVALSRARNGLYIMGNMKLLCNKSNLWCEINKKLVKQDAIGTSLALRCQIHDKITNVETEDDFTKVPEGGCDLNCNAELICGHICNSVCHLKDRDHNDFKCLEPCGRHLCEDDGHICRKRCFEICGPCCYLVTRLLPCDHIIALECHINPQEYKCKELVLTQLDCGHTENRPCHISPEDFICPHPCDNRVEQCGHACTLLCHVSNDPDHLTYKCVKPCAKPRIGCTFQKGSHICRNKCHEECEPCVVKVKKKRTICLHVYEVACNANADEIKCEKPCIRRLLCTHKCSKKCFEDCGLCGVQVEKTIPECGHKIKLKCFEKPERKHCRAQCERELPCGHRCRNKCSEPCTTQCRTKRKCNLMSLCGHIVQEITCYKNISNNDPSLLKYCTNPCGAMLKCEHMCKGTCGTCFQGRIHERCKEKCGAFLICNHECPIPCKDACKPCERNCSHRCSHSSCKKKCGDICVKCTEKCDRKCMHQQCANLCGDICSVGPCIKPCPKQLKCRHPCIGFCNDPCPRKCRICDKDEVTELFFGDEDEEGVRFVELQDCQHILESTGIEKWLSQEGGEIQSKVCPKCKTPIINTQRYSDYVKRAIIDIDRTKKKLLGSLEENNQRRAELLERIKVIQYKSLKIPSVSKFYHYITKIVERLQELRHMKNKGTKNATNIIRQPINGLVLNSVTSRVQILEYIMEICSIPNQTFRYGDAGESSEIKTQVNFILNSLVRDEDQITIQEIEDIELEINRLKRIVEICQIQEQQSMYSKLSLTNSKFVQEEKKNESIEQIKNLVITFNKYTKIIDDEVQGMLKKISSYSPISIAEKQDIVKAMGLTKGHWFKCPNGHPYVITECGGAMQEFDCPECGERIGGSHHTLLSTNRLATEMDGAQYAAWSQLANMGNYDL